MILTLALDYNLKKIQKEEYKKEICNKLGFCILILIAMKSIKVRLGCV